MNPALAARRLGLLFAACCALAAPLVVREGWVERGYPDPVHGRTVPTACAGVTKGVVIGRIYTPEECLAMTATAMVEHAAPIMACVRDDFPATGSAYLAEMVDMAFNIGATGFVNSSMCRRMRAADYAGACEAILLYRFAGGVDCATPGNRTCAGLWKRRLESRAACRKAIP